QMVGYRRVGCGINGKLGFVDRLDYTVRFWSGGYSNSCLGEVDPSLWQPHQLNSLGCGDTCLQHSGVSHTDIFGGVHDQSAGDEAGVFATGDHPGHPVDSGVGIRPTHRFDERGDDVIVLVTVTVVTSGYSAGNTLDVVD